MTSTSAGELDLGGVLDAMPRARMAKYLDATPGRRQAEDALELYQWNLRVSTALWEVVCHAEVTLRHAIDIALTERHENLGRERDWVFFALEESEGGSEMGSCLGDLETAYSKLQRQVGRGRSFQVESDIGADDVIAAVDFGFWKYMVSTDKEPKFGTRIRRGFINAPRGKTSNDMTFLRQVVNPLHAVRNRIAHHEPLCFNSGRFIANKFDNAVTLIKFFDEDLSQWVESQSQVGVILSKRPTSRR